ncbi:MAG: glutaredoxin family protein [Proteobacteria bacterium]|nr:glutaredoxin family protein [Pseudomonadota bacterium]NOG59370.1 glutaredoxin family protein [Pseudomonadota bacterium]
MTDDRLVLSIYSRPECHLCDEMVEALKKWQQRFNFKIEIIDIDKDSRLTARFAARIPLLTMADTEICEYHLDEFALLDFLENKG